MKIQKKHKNWHKHNNKQSQPGWLQVQCRNVLGEYARHGRRQQPCARLQLLKIYLVSKIPYFFTCISNMKYSMVGPGGDYYCDANFVNDNWWAQILKKKWMNELLTKLMMKRCPEYDTYEGNAETTNVALHTCDYVPPNDYPRFI